MNPEIVFNNVLFRQLANRLDFLEAREVIAQAALPLVFPPWQRRAMLARVAGHLETCFPELSPGARQATLTAFEGHWIRKLAEDTVALNLKGKAAHLKAIESHVVFQGRENLMRAFEQGHGVLAVYCHVGSPSFAMNSFLSRLPAWGPPEERWRRIRLCAEPEVERFPFVRKTIRDATADHGVDLDFALKGEGYGDTRTVASELVETLAGGGLATTGLDVLGGGSSRRPFPMFGGRIHLILSALVGAAKTALRAGAVILPFVNYRTAHGFVVQVEPHIGPVPKLEGEVSEERPEVLDLCEQLRALLERWIVAHIEQWTYWDRLHKRLCLPPEEFAH